MPAYMTRDQTEPRREYCPSVDSDVVLNINSVVTAVYQGTNPRTGSSVLLRSYDSRKEPPPEYNCKIWEAGRATSAIGLAFKPIQIGQTVFIDEGAGKFNPAPQLLEEAAINEWPGRDVGVFVSIGTGKRPEGTNARQSEWWEDFVGGSMGAFADARRRLISKIEGCEETHQQMLKSELAKRGVPTENYYRLNVSVGLGEFAMNEWQHLSPMTVNTRKYLNEPATQKALMDMATKMGKIELTKRRQERQLEAHNRNSSWSLRQQGPPPSSSHPDAVELPAGDEAYQTTPPHQYRVPAYPPYPSDPYGTSEDKYVLVQGEATPPRMSSDLPYRGRDEKMVVPQQSQQSGPIYSQPQVPPPRPPKTPINETGYAAHPSQRLSPNNRTSGAHRLPYPDDDEPPPQFNRYKKPEFIPRQ
jgi:hypothetical protein